MNWKHFRGQIVLLLDLSIYASVSLLLFWLASSQNNIDFSWFLKHFFLMLICITTFQMIFKTYDSLWRYAETREYLTLLAGMACALGTYLIFMVFFRANSTWIIHAIASSAVALVLMLLMRFIYRTYRTHVNGVSRKTRRYLAIVGAGDSGVNLLRELMGNSNSPYIPYCFLDDSSEKMGKTVAGIPILGPISNIIELLEHTPVSEIILAISGITPARRSQILQLCSHTNCKIQMLPDSFYLHENHSSIASNIRNVEIEDLLGRESIHFDNPAIKSFISGKKVFVTGASGSIGSELCRQIARHQPSQLVLIDIAENTTYELQHDLLRTFGKDFPLSIEIASVRDQPLIDHLFRTYRPDLVFHAAAHKHVPLMEACVEEAIKNNIFGTYYVAKAAKKFHVQKFVLISTDKAVNPTNVMGATKHFCEKIMHTLRADSDTQFTAVRFGNVLDSNGSVIPLFKKQIACGGPVTVTDKRIIRYFMTISEAVELILQCGAMASSGEVYVLDMGDPVRIYDLAENLIRLSGFSPHTDIPITEIGLRPGEKLFEELLTSNGTLCRTVNKKIFVELQPMIDPIWLETGLSRLRQAMHAHDRLLLLETLRSLVPTFEDPDIFNQRAIERAVAYGGSLHSNELTQPLQGRN